MQVGEGKGYVALQPQRDAALVERRHLRTVLLKVLLEILQCIQLMLYGGLETATLLNVCFNISRPRKVIDLLINKIRNCIGKACIVFVTFMLVWRLYEV